MQGIEASSLARWMREAMWAYPAVEAVHILALGIVVGSIVIVDLRLLGLSREISVSRLSRHALPFTIGAFVVAMFTGILMFTAHAEDFLTNPGAAIHWTAGIGGTTQGQIEWRLYLNDILYFGQEQLLDSGSATSPGGILAFSDMLSGWGLDANGDGFYGAQLWVKITHAGAGTTSFDFNGHVPEPGSLAPRRR